MESVILVKKNVKARNSMIKKQDMGTKYCLRTFKSIPEMEKHQT